MKMQKQKYKKFIFVFGLFIILLSLFIYATINYRLFSHIVNTPKSAQNPALFDISIIIPEVYEKVHPGEEILATIKLINFGHIKRADVVLQYQITDIYGNTILEKQETIAIETQASVTRSFYLSPETLPGKYYLSTKVLYGLGEEAIATASFNLINKKANIFNIISWATGIIIIMLILFYTSKLLKKFKERISIRWRIHNIVKKKLRE